MPKPSTSVAIRAGGLVRRFGGTVAVRGVDLEVAAGEAHALVGLNGAGKSTLLRLLVGLLRPDRGTVELWDRPAWRAPSEVRARVGYVGGGRTYGELTVVENLVGAARLHGCPRTEARRRSAELVEALALDRWASRPARTLSSGNRQRLALASALIHDPDLLVLDEPTTALDPAGVLELRRIVADRLRSGVAVVVSSHHLDEMARMASVISVLHDGKVVGRLPPGGADLERQFFATVHAAAHIPAGAT